MTEQRQPRPRRILLGVAGTQELTVTIDTAVMMASSFGASLQCVMVEHEDLFAVAGLPFARAFGRGGMSSPVTIEAVAGYFRRVERTIEHELIERCGRVNVRWGLARPHGDYVREVLASVEEGDVVVISRGDLQARPEDLVAIAGSILEKAAAVVFPGSGAGRGGPVLALSGDEANGGAAALAGGIAAATGRKLDQLTPTAFLTEPHRAAIVVASRQELDSRLLGIIQAMGAATVIVR